MKVQSALALAASGFSVFPITANASKPPALRNWQEKATTDPEQINAWWREDPDYNIGVATGKGLLVVDADCKGGRPGLDSLEMLDMLGLPTGFRVNTPSGGRHVYLHTEQSHSNRVDSIPDYPGIDIRADGGYVVGPGSTISGKEYAIAAGKSDNIPNNPQWFDDHLKTTAGKHLAHTDHPLTDLDRPEHVDKAVHYLTHQANEAIEGAGGNGATYLVATALRDFAISESLALELMLEHWNEAKASPPWNPDELATIVGNAFNYASGGWGAKTAAAEFGEVEIDIGEPPSKRFNTDFLEQPKKPGEQAREPKLIRASMFAGMDRPEREFLVHGLIPHKNVTLLSGDGGTGKSLLALQLATSMLSGRKWIGQAVERFGPVLYFSAEDDEDETHIRLKEICSADGIDLASLDDLHIALMAGEDALLVTEHTPGAALKKTPLFGRLQQWLQRIRPALLILDNLVDIFGGNQNAPTLARQFIGALRGLSIEYDCAVLLLAHPSLSGMTSGSGTAGTVAWSNSARSRMYLQRHKDNEGTEADPNLRYLEVKKANYGPTGSQIDMRWDNGRFVALDDIDMSELDDPGCVTETKVERAERIFKELLARFLKERRHVSPAPGANYAPAVFARHPQAGGVGKAYFEIAMNNLLGRNVVINKKVGPPSRQVQSMVFAREENEGVQTPSDALQTPTQKEGV